MLDIVGKKRIGLLLLIQVLIMAISCSEKKERPPVSLEKMQSLMVDLHLAETYSVGLYPDSLRKKFDKNPDSLAVYYAAILAHHHLDITQFKTAVDWYKQHPEMLDSLYNRVLSLANELQAEQEKKETEAGKNKPGRDSANVRAEQDTSYVKKQRDSLRLNRRLFQGDTPGKNNKPVR